MAHLKSFMLSWVVSCCCCLECWPVFLEVDWCCPLVLALFYRLLQHRCASRKTTNKLQRGSSTGAPLEKNDAHANCQQKQFRKYVQLKAERGGHSHYRKQNSALQTVLFRCCTWGLRRENLKQSRPRILCSPAQLFCLEHFTTALLGAASPQVAAANHLPLPSFVIGQCSVCSSVIIDGAVNQVNRGTNIFFWKFSISLLSPPPT